MGGRFGAEDLLHYRNGRRCTRERPPRCASCDDSRLAYQLDHGIAEEVHFEEDPSRRAMVHEGDVGFLGPLVEFAEAACLPLPEAVQELAMKVLGSTAAEYGFVVVGIFRAEAVMGVGQTGKGTMLAEHEFLDDAVVDSKSTAMTALCIDQEGRSRL